MDRREFIRRGLGLGGIIAAGKASPEIVKGLVGSSGTEWVDESEEPRVYTAADYVQDGLMSLYDAIENCGYGEEHSDNPQFWLSCVGDGTLPDAYGRFANSSKCGQFVDDGFWCNTANGQRTFPTKITGQKHIEVCCILSDNLAQGVWLPTGYGGDLKIVTQIHASYGMYIPLQYGSGKKIVLPPIAERTTISLKTGMGYVNGKEAITEIAETTWGWNFAYADTDAGCIGSVSGREQRYMPRALFCLRAYNRELTKAEIKWNYKVDKARFNLP